MKKTLSLLLVLVMALTLLSACGQSGGSGGNGGNADAAGGAVDIDSLNTIGDVLALNSEGSTQYALYGDYFIYAFEQDGATYQVIAEVPEDASEALWALEWDDPDHDAKLAELVGPLEIIRCTNLNDGIPSQEELDKLVGKTAGELMEDNWFSGGWNLDNMEFWMNHDTYSFTVILEGEIEKDFDEFEDEDMYPLVVKSITCDGIGDATYIELDDDGKLID